MPGTLLGAKDGTVNKTNPLLPSWDLKSYIRSSFNTL